MQAVVGDGVAVAVRDAGDEAAGFESAQVVGGLAGTVTLVIVGALEGSVG